MNKRVLALAVAAAIVSPLTAAADVKLSGKIQAEIVSAKFADADRITVTSDGVGAVKNGGPNHIGFTIDEKMASGLTAYAKINRGFDTFDAGTGLSAREHYIGLKGSGAYIQFGRMAGIYKYGNKLDPLSTTGVQARGAGGSTNTAYGHSGYWNNAIQAGFSSNGFGVHGQYMAGENSANDGSMAVRADYSNKTMTAYASYVMQDDGTDNEPTNIEVGGKYTIGGLTLGLKYEMAEVGTLDGGDGDYIFASASYKMGNIMPTMWIAQYSADADNEDALSYSAALIYSFSKRTMTYVGYHKTDSDNNTRDWDAFGVGVRHAF